MDDKLLVLAEIVGKLRKQVKELSQNTAEVKKLEGPQGPKGEKGDAGRDGKPGKDGKDGLSGRDGRDGADGKDGKDGVSVTDANIAADGSLVITLSDGSEVDAGPILTDVKASVIHNLSGGGGGSQQEVFIGAPAVLPTYPALIFETTTIGGETVYTMKVNVP
jgi:hypothetical protein